MFETVMGRSTIFLLVVILSPSGLHAATSPDSLTLSQAVRIALEQNPDALAARSRLAEAEARLRSVKAGAFPTLKARATYDFWTEDQRLFPATENGQAGAFGDQVWAAELSANLLLYTGGRLSAEKDAADHGRRTARDEAARLQQVLAYQVTNLFYGLLAQDAVLRSLDTAVAAMDEQTRTIEALVEAERAARVDLLRANVRRAELYERRLREQAFRSTQLRAWAALLGRTDAADPAPRGSLELSEPPLCPDAGRCMEMALERRPDYRGTQAVVSAAEALLRAARASYLPTVAIHGAFGARGMPDPAFRPDGVEKEQSLGRIGVAAELPLFDGGLTSSRVAQAEARLEVAREGLRKLELQIRYEVETALSDLIAAEERVRTTDMAVAQAEESFRIVKEKYDLGKGTMTDVLDAQTALVTAQTSYARALADLAVADAKRKLAIGEMLP